MKATISLTYNDSKVAFFEVVTESSEKKDIALIEMVTRGTLMASNAKYAHAYNEDGFDICSYKK